MKWKFMHHEKTQNKNASNSIIIFCILWCSIALHSVPALGRNSFLDSLNHRQEVKKTTRWTLADWFATREKVRLMDLWLAANTSDPLFEFYLEGSRTSLEEATSSIDTYAFGAFVSIIGLRGERNQFNYFSETADSYSIQVRLLGKAEQATNLTLKYGVRSIEDTDSTSNLVNQFYGGHLRVYLLDFLGLYGDYKIFSLSDSSEVENLEGNSWEYGMFFDVSIFQIFANSFNEKRRYVTNGEVRNLGTKIGLKVYF